MLKIKTIDLKDEIEALLIPVCEDAQIHDDPNLMRMIDAVGAFDEFKGKKGDRITLHSLPDCGVQRAVFMGLGEAQKVDAEALRSLAGKAVAGCIEKGLKTLDIAVPRSGRVGMEAAAVCEALLEGAFLGNHLFDRYRSEKKKAPLEAIALLSGADDLAPETVSAIPKRVSAVCGGALQAREWVSMPPNDKRPDAFAEDIVRRAGEKGVEAQVLDEQALEKENMGALMAVAAGSQAPPRLVVLDHNPEGAEETVVLVGKGVTFDSGGINLKSSEGLKNMKMDMAGAAAVAGTVIAAAGLPAVTRIVGVIPIVENMPSGAAYRPGDIVRGVTGKSIEIGNTDAEGRLILADAIAWAEKRYKPDFLIDLATLTGACVMALGEHIAGIFSPDDALADRIVASGENTFERCWRMPLPEDYRELLKSDLADISNMSSSRWGGAITAALFLSEFAKETRWAHIDIAGPAHRSKKSDYCGAGGTGFGVRLLCDFIERL